MNKIEATLIYNKETKNMVRYDAPGGKDAQRGCVVPNIYVRKSDLTAAFGQYPNAIQITIEAKV